MVSSLLVFFFCVSWPFPALGLILGFDLLTPWLYNQGVFLGWCWICVGLEWAKRKGEWIWIGLFNKKGVGYLFVCWVV